MLCLLPGPLAYSILPSRFILLHFLQNLSERRLRNVWNREQTLTWLVRYIVFRPDVSETVDWALKSKYLPTYLPN